MNAREQVAVLRTLAEPVRWVGPNDHDKTIICNLCCAKVIDAPSTRAQHEDFHAGIAALVRRSFPGVFR